jgi:hypothetical protein
MITKLENLDQEDYTNTINWDYDFIVSEDNNGLSLYNNDIEIAYINEDNWLINIKDFNSKIKILPSNNRFNVLVYPKIILLNNEEEVYYEYIKVIWNNKVILLNDFNELYELSKDGIYITFTDKASYNYYIIPESSNYNPWILSIYRNTDVEKQELFSIFPDWRVNTINDYYTLEYFEYNWNIWYKLIDKHFNKEVARVLLKISWEYLIK